MFDKVIIHYDEIGLKGKNRKYFEKLLVDNITKKAGKVLLKGFRESGQITFGIIPQTNQEEITEILSKIPGIAYFSFAKKVDLDLETIKKEAVTMINSRDFETFKVNAKRHDKSFKYSSMDINCAVGEAISALNRKAKMKNPDLMLKIEITKDSAYLSCEDVSGTGGLPTNQKQKVVVLLSGGLDSPVAAYMMMKRGCEAILVHCHNKNQSSDAVGDKIIRLSEALSKFQIKTKLFIVPFENIQKEIIMKAPSTTRMIVYRRFMIKIASVIAEKEKARFLVVGDSLSQVASQTIENLEATYKDSDKAVFTPLIGFDKNEITKISQKINTYDISILPYGDCCSYFLPKHPVLNINNRLLDRIESNIDADSLIKEAVSKADVKIIE